MLWGPLTTGLMLVGTILFWGSVLRLVALLVHWLHDVARKILWLFLVVLAVGLAVNSTPVLAAPVPVKDRIIIQNGGERYCNALLDEWEQGGAFMVQARVYAGCIGASYTWPYHGDGNAFALTKTVKVDLFAHGRVTVVFHVDNPNTAAVETSMAETYLNGELQDEFNLTNMKMGAYERGGAGGPNMAPLRFTNDVFRLGTNWRGNYGAVYTAINDYPGAYAPLWDRQRLPGYVWTIGRDNLPGQPGGGWEILPSTLYHFRDTAPMILSLESEARQSERPHQVNWVSGSFMHLDHSGGVPVTSFTSDHGRLRMTTYWHDKVKATAYKTEIEKKKMNTNYLGGGVSAGLALMAVLAPQYAIPVGILTASTAVSTGIASWNYDFQLADINYCMTAADLYKEQRELKTWSMGLEWTGNGVVCHDHFDL